MRRRKQDMIKSLFTFLALEIMTTDFFVSGFNGDPWGFIDRRIQSTYSRIPVNRLLFDVEKSGIQTPLIDVIEDKRDDLHC